MQESGLIEIIPFICMSPVWDQYPVFMETGSKTIPKKKNSKKAKWLSEEALKIAVKRREAKKQRRKGKI